MAKKSTSEPQIDAGPAYYDIIPEYNSTGRLCNYHTGDGDTVRVPADEWERFNELAGRQHEVIDGIVRYNPDLPPCVPDDIVPPDPMTDLSALYVDHEYRLIMLELGV